MNIINIINKVYNKTLFRFMVVGGIGSILNLSIFYILADIFNINVSISAIIAFSGAVTQNYLLNSRYTFNKFNTIRLSLWLYSKYVAVNLIGLVVNLIIVNILVTLYSIWPKVFAQFIGIVIGMAINYFGSKVLVFSKK